MLNYQESTNQKRSFYFLVVGLLLTLLVLSSTQSVVAASGPMIEAQQVGSLGTEARVPVTIRNVSDLTSGQFQVSVPAGGNVTFKNFKPSPGFNGGLFRTVSTNSDNTVTIDFVSTTNSAQRIVGNSIVVGHLTYKINASVSRGQEIPLELSGVVARGRNNAELSLAAHNGNISRMMMAGDVIGQNQVTAGGAIRILQHVQGNPITDQERLRSADVDGDGLVTHNDVLDILRHIVGLKDSLLAVKSTELGMAPIGFEYSEVMEAGHGNEPYTWSTRGRLPTGLVFDTKTGVISGKATRAGDSTVTFTVTDRSGNTASRELTIEAKESDVQSTQKINPIAVIIGEQPNLPAQVEVTFKNGSKETVNVTWDAVDTFSAGTKTAKGKVGTTGMIVTVQVSVTSDGKPIEGVTDEVRGVPIKDVTSKYVSLFNAHTILVKSSSEVFALDIQAKVKDSRGRTQDVKIPMHFEGDNNFSLASPRLESRATVQIIAYDQFGKEIMKEPHLLD